MTTPIMDTLRREFHKDICKGILGYRNKSGKPCLTCADKDSELSRMLSNLMFPKLNFSACISPPGPQLTGTRFTKYVCEFVDRSFSHLMHIRPGDWVFSVTSTGISAFDQYEHLARLDEAVKNNSDLKAVMGSDYLIKPDIVVIRRPLRDSDINEKAVLLQLTSKSAKRTPLRESNGPKSRGILHASISCKWTLRSDRAQNMRTEALNLIRNRKGRTPHICAVTMEPLPSRLASIALGTGDIDCVYHAALDELLAAAREHNDETALDLLEMLVDTRRLRDISDLPFDLAQ